MTDVTIPQLPPAIALSAIDQIEIVQNGASKSATLGLLIPLYPPLTPGMPGVVTRRQFFAACAALADMNLLYQAISPDWNNTTTIEFWSAYVVQVTDALAILAQNTFGWSGAQLSACFVLAATLPQ